MRTTTSATATFSNNPRLSTAAHAQAMYLELSTEPRLTSTSETTTLDLSARLAHRRYSRRYGAETYANARLGGTSKRSERWEVSGAANISYDAAADVVDDIAAAVDPRGVRIHASASLSGRLRLSEKATLAPSFLATRNRYAQSDTLKGYNSFATGVGYARQFSNRTSAGLRLDGAQQRYQANGQSSVIALLVTGQTSLTEFMTFKGSVGTERVVVSMQGRSASVRQMLSGNASLCSRRLRMNLCALAAAGSDATALGTLRRRLSAGLTLSHRPTERTNYTLAADLQRSTALGNDALGKLNFFSGRASVDHDLGKLLTLTGFTNYRMRSGGGTVGAVTLGAGLRFKTGRN